jgi:hypothetical protein
MGTSTSRVPRVQVLTIPHELPTLNEMLNAKAIRYSKGASAYSEMKKKADRSVRWLAVKHLTPVVTFPIQVHFLWVRQNKRTDKDNIAAAVKFVFDGLVEASILPNDGWAELGNWTNDFAVDADNPRVVVTITEGEQDGAGSNTVGGAGRGDLRSGGRLDGDVGKVQARVTTASQD